LNIIQFIWMLFKSCQCCHSVHTNVVQLLLWTLLFRSCEYCFNSWMSLFNSYGCCSTCLYVVGQFTC